jgi:hypothetical protein
MDGVRFYFISLFSLVVFVVDVGLIYFLLFVLFVEFLLNNRTTEASKLFEAVTALQSKNDLSWTEQINLVLFWINAFQSLELDVIRSCCLK